MHWLLIPNQPSSSLRVSDSRRKFRKRQKWNMDEKHANNFQFASTEIVLDLKPELNIVVRILVKCRALASVTAAVSNKIAVLQAARYYDANIPRVFISESCGSAALYVCNRIRDAARESRGKSIRKSQTWSRLQFSNWKCGLPRIPPTLCVHNTTQTIN